MSELKRSSSQLNERHSKQSSSEDSDACVLCCKEVEIYSIGECDHAICYECSTRLRVLCEQNECPICRQVLSKVIFTCDKLPYRELETKNRSGYYSKKYKIGFYTAKIQQAFFNLLDHPCPKCNVPPFRRFSDLEYHVRKEHDLHYCDLCIEHLKIFTFERRCYTQTELGLHRTKGDRDNRSHRGHPLCEFCKKRYLDRDELFRHKRRDHYFCHFCDDESNDFYRDYEALANHFREHHYLCEEGRCATEQFIGAFRTEIDYKAHFASVHGKNLNKQEAKKTRTVQLEITLGRPARPGLPDGGIANVRSRVPDDNYPAPAEPSTSQAAQQQRSITIEEGDFPLLSGSSGGPSVSLVPAPFARMRSGASGLARTKENFPALGAGGEANNQQRQQSQQQQSAPPISTVLRKAPSVSKGAISRTTGSSSGGGVGGGGGGHTGGPNNTSGMVLHVSNRPKTTTTPTTNNVHNSSGAVSKKSSAMDFPALPPASGKSGGKKNAPSRTPLDEDMLPSGEQIPLSNVAAKHRTLLDDYVSVANPSHYQKIQTVQKEELEAKTRRAIEQASVPKLTSQDFPSLGGGGGGSVGSGGGVRTASKSNHHEHVAPNNNWGKDLKLLEKKQRELENRKAKVAQPPNLTKDSGNNKQQNNNATNKKQSTTTVPATTTARPTNANTVEQQNNSKKEKKPKEKKQEKSNAENTNQQQQQQQQKVNDQKVKEKNNNNNNYSNNSQKCDNRPIATPRPPATTIEFPPLINGNNADMSAQQKIHTTPLDFGQQIRNTYAQPPSPTPPPSDLKATTNVTVNSIAKPPNNLTFTNSFGENYSIRRTHTYIHPPEASIRNQRLVFQFQDALETNEAMEEFRYISQKFREGIYKTQPYYEHCLAALQDRFNEIFPELLALLPDINKQQELYLAHSQHLNQLSPIERKHAVKLEVCAVCKQVLIPQDMESHKKQHDLKENFPELGNVGGRNKQNNNTFINANQRK